MNDLIMMVKNGVDLDGFLSWLHILVMMDDTVLLATTRVNMIQKVRILRNYCVQYGMKVNESKTKFFVINGGENDREPLRVDGLSVERCDNYVYLGSHFTADGSTSSAVKAHAVAKMSHVLKFISFVKKERRCSIYCKKTSI